MERLSSCNATQIGANLGKVLVMDLEVDQLEDCSDFMRVQVESDLHLPLSPGFFFQPPNASVTWISFKYERLLGLCYHCGCIDHLLSQCASVVPHLFQAKLGVCMKTFPPWRDGSFIVRIDDFSAPPRGSPLLPTTSHVFAIAVASGLVPERSGTVRPMQVDVLAQSHSRSTFLVPSETGIDRGSRPHQLSLNATPSVSGPLGLTGVVFPSPTIPTLNLLDAFVTTGVSLSLVGFLGQPLRLVRPLLFGSAQPHNLFFIHLAPLHFPHLVAWVLISPYPLMIMTPLRL